MQPETGSAEWDIVTGVGLTALGVAAGRAVETSRGDGLVDDPFAAAFVRAAGEPMAMPTRLGGAEQEALPWAAMATYMGVRSRFFDTFFTAASRAGLRQVVLLAAGLDTRAYRLDWSPGTVVFEIDAPKVLEFKDSVLAGQDAHPRCTRRAVAADLREDWPAALRQSGFDTAAPTAWLAEGLLPFLPDEAKDRLFTEIHGGSAAGSRIAAEHLDGDVAALLDEPMFQDMARTFGFDMASLWPAEQHFDAAGWLTGHGWSVTAEASPHVAERYGRPFDDAVLQPMRSSTLLTAELPGPA